MNKQALRSLARIRRNTFIQDNFCQIPLYPDFLALLTGQCSIAGYVAIGSEADPILLLEAARERGCSIVLPRITSRDESMTFHCIESNTQIEQGPYGLRQPPSCAPVIAPEIILLPLLGFTRRGDRLGQGGGHYDRALTHLPNATCIGVAWSVQEMAELPTEPWDVLLQYIVTEKEWIKV